MDTKNFREEVQEVIDFALQCHFLFGNAPPEGLNVKVVSEIPKESWDAGPDGKDYNDLKDDEHEFSGIRSMETRKVFGVLFKNKNKNSEIEQVTQLFLNGRLYKMVLRNLPVQLDKRDLIANFIAGDMFDCTQSRVVLGKSGNFWDVVFEIYKSGGMPIGWSGKYPDGRLMAIYPGLKTK
jgi:hypothetical protein